MATEIIMPKVDMVMEAGTFVEWLKQEGETIQKGEALFVIQTDKAAIEVESPESGILAGTTARADDVIPVSSVIGYLLQSGEDLPAQGKAAKAAAKATASAAALDKETIFAAAQQPTQESAHQEVGHQKVGRQESGYLQVASVEIRATPLARRLARELELNLANIQGSGPRGRIYRADVERYSQSIPANPSAAEKIILPIQPISAPVLPARERKRVRIKGAREMIAQRMTYSAQKIPHIHISLEVDMSESARLREKVNPVYKKEGGRGVSYTAIIAHAAAHLLGKFPSLNCSLVDDELIYWEDVHLGIATDLEESLVVPVVRSAQNKKLVEVADEINRLVEQARSRKLQPAEMSGSTFTISNLGMLGAVSFTAIINPPETAILAVGRIIDTPVAIGREIAIRPMMNLTVAVDHRVTDGAQATRFLSALKEVLENPYLLV